MGFWFWLNMLTAVFCLVLSLVLAFTADPWIWAGPMALAHIFMQYAREEIKSDRQ